MSQPPGARSPVTALTLVPAAGAYPFVSRSATLQGGLGAAAKEGGCRRRNSRLRREQDDPPLLPSLRPFWRLAQRGGAFACVIDAPLARRGLRKARSSELLAAR